MYPFNNCCDHCLLMKWASNELWNILSLLTLYAEFWSWSRFSRLNFFISFPGAVPKSTHLVENYVGHVYDLYLGIGTPSCFWKIYKVFNLYKYCINKFHWIVYHLICSALFVAQWLWSNEAISIKYVMYNVVYRMRNNIYMPVTYGCEERRVDGCDYFLFQSISNSNEKNPIILLERSWYF